MERARATANTGKSRIREAFATGNGLADLLRRLNRPKEHVEVLEVLRLHDLESMVSPPYNAFQEKTRATIAEMLNQNLKTPSPIATSEVSLKSQQTRMLAMYHNSTTDISEYVEIGSLAYWDFCRWVWPSHPSKIIGENLDFRLPTRDSELEEIPAGRSPAINLVRCLASAVVTKGTARGMDVTQSTPMQERATTIKLIDSERHIAAISTRSTESIPTTTVFVCSHLRLHPITLQNALREAEPGEHVKGSPEGNAILSRHLARAGSIVNAATALWSEDFNRRHPGATAPYSLQLLDPPERSAAEGVREECMRLGVARVMHGYGARPQSFF